jgi:hypothetical protein
MTLTWGEERAALRQEVRDLTGHRTSGVRHCPSCAKVLVSTRADFDEGLRSTEWWCTGCGYSDRGAVSTLSVAAALAILHPQPVVEHELAHVDSPWPEEEL